MSWEILDPSEITDEDRRIMADLIQEERRDRERGFWRFYPDSYEEDNGEYAEHDPDL